ncbi:hypothetical protein PAV_11c01880 [Paenibacillus alvei DSM 29]|nr:hypothetical protein PAV_11c01880 [Paenibacillus alvei DSM 29]
MNGCRIYNSLLKNGAGSFLEKDYVSLKAHQG